MTSTLEVFADVTCPFTHVGLHVVQSRLGAMARSVDVVVRAWPLEWVNGQPLDSDDVAVKIDALRTQLDLDIFTGFSADRWPTTSIPALNLAEMAYRVDVDLGYTVSLQLRDLLFEQGQDIADMTVLGEVAGAHGLTSPPVDATEGVEADYDAGRRRGVRGSPDFWIDGDDFFCPALEIGHDERDALTARFDTSGLQEMLDRLEP